MEGIGVPPGEPWKLRYWSVFGGQALSMIGSALTQFVLIWWIADTTGSVAALSLAGLFALLPHALLSPLGGTIADRHSRRLLMIIPDIISAICMLVLVVLFITERVELWHIYTMMFIRSSMQAFQQPAAAASAAMLVPLDFLPRAAGLNQSLQGLIVVASAPLGALAIGLMPFGYALTIDVVTAVLGVVPLLFFAVPQPAVSRANRTTIWRDFREGFDVVWSSPALRQLYGLMALVTMLVMPSFTLAPLLVKEHLGGGAAQVAMMEGLAGAAMIAGGFLAAALAPKRRIPWILWGFSFACFALAFTALAPGNMLWLGTLWWMLSGLVFILGNAPLTALLQTTIPNRLQGRALALMTTLSALAAPIGLAAATPLGALLGVRGLFVAMGLAGGFVCLLGFASKALKRMDIEGRDPGKAA